MLRPLYEIGEGLVYVQQRYDKAFALTARISVNVFITYSFGFFLLVEIVIFLWKKIKLKRERRYRKLKN